METSIPLWPLRVENGELKLVGTFQGFFGSDYDGVREFDVMMKAYGRRHHVQ